jgi:uncharacterized protein (DUF927 family)
MAPLIELREGWRSTLEALLDDDRIRESPDTVVSAVRALVLRISGVSMLAFAPAGSSSRSRR